MATLSKKIDFALIMGVKNANPNGDPLNGNRPRTDYEGLGEITDVCLKRKIRDRLLERYVKLPEGEKDGQAIFVQSEDRKCDNAKSLKSRADAALGKTLGSAETTEKACKTWLDVRAFGQLFAFKADKGKEKDKENTEGDSGTSIGIRGPVTIQSAFSLERVSVVSTQITKSVSGEDPKPGKTKGSDTMGMKHRVDKAVYVTFGSMNPQLAEKTGFSDEDAQIIKTVLPRLFENDASSARPEGSMEVLAVIWWEHNCKAGNFSSAKVHHTLTTHKDGTFDLVKLDGIKTEEIPGY